MSKFLSRKFARWHRRKDGFDPRSYYLANPDLRIFADPRRLREEWRLHGNEEVRLGSGISPYADRRPWNGVLSNPTPKVAYFGPVSAVSGLGVAARGYVSALSILDVDLEVIDTTASLYPRSGGSISALSGPADIVILHQNADSLGNLFRLMDRKLLDGVYTIGIWVWEVMAFRSEWLEAFGAVDEIWAPSTFVTDSIQTIAPVSVPVRTIPHVVEASTRPLQSGRSDFGIPEDAFTFLCVFDASSAFERKNPRAVLDAFVEAFESDPAAFLVMKFHSSDAEPEKISALRSDYSRSNILFLDHLLSDDESAALKQLTDCLVSAHRSEGFGLNIAEAMAAAKPVICTEYSGNLMFCDETNCLLVPSRLCEVGEGTRHYPAGSVWAEPDHQSLVAAMLKVFVDRAFAQSLGQRAAQTIKLKLARETIAALMSRSLEEAQDQLKSITQNWKQRSQLAWRHPGALGSKHFAEGRWPTFSLILTVHDAEPVSLEKCLKSVISQTYPYWELCISDNGSSDRQTLNYLNTVRCRDQRIRIRRLISAAGASAAVMAAVEMATGEFLVFLDPMHVLKRKALATYVSSIAKTPGCSVLYSGEEGTAEEQILAIRKKFFLENNADLAEESPDGPQSILENGDERRTYDRLHSGRLIRR